MKKTKIDRSIDTEALGFQVRESYKTARTNIAYSIFKKGCKKVAFTSSTKGEGKTVTSINVASASFSLILYFNSFVHLPFA